MSKPTRKDAELILKIAELGASMGIGDANAVLFGAEAPTPEKFPPNTPEGSAILQSMRWFETIGTLYRNGTVNEDLLFDWLAITAFWERMKPFALEIREQSGNPAMWENFEYMAERASNWTPKRD